MYSGRGRSGVRTWILPASRAPGVSSVGMMRAIAASTVARWWESKNMSGHQEGTEGPVRHLQAGFDLRLGPAPQRILVLDGQDPVEPALVQRVDHPGPVHLAEPRHPVAPPAD